MTTAELLPILIGSSGVTAVLISVVTALFNKRKLRADATSIISQAAGGLVEQIAADNTRLRAENATLEGRADRLESAARRRDKRDAKIQASIAKHNDYDIELAQMLRDAGINVPDPPALVWPED